MVPNRAVAQQVKMGDRQEPGASADPAARLLEDGEIVLVVQLVQVEDDARAPDVPRLEQRIVGSTQPVHLDSGTTEIPCHTEPADRVVADDEGWGIRGLGLYGPGRCHSGSLGCCGSSRQGGRSCKSYHSRGR